MDKDINNNGYDYVDLGLPSGTLWATMNVGADKPSEYGLYFQWGDTQGYTMSQVGTKSWQKNFTASWRGYKWGKSPNFTKYTNPGDTLELEDDAAHVHMGGDWHMPTSEQIKELIDNTTSTWTMQDGRPGRIFTSKKDESKSIFIPAAGYAWGDSVHDSGYNGSIWSSMLNAIYDYTGQSLDFNSSNVVLYDYNRYGGFSVRGVIG